MKKNKKRKRSDDVTVLKTPEKDKAEDSSFDGLNFDSFSALFTSSMSQYGDVYQSPAPSFSPQQVAYQQPHQQAFMPPMQTGNNPPPQWVTALTNELRDIKVKLSKLESIECTLNGINSKVEKLDKTVVGMEQRLDIIENTTKSLCDACDDHKVNMDLLQSSTSDLVKQVESMKVDNKKLQQDNENVKRTLLDLQPRSMRGNLLFFGIGEV